MRLPRPRRDGNEAGFTLVELLVVVAILGILAAIGISQFAGYKQRSVDGLMTADLHSARTSMEAYYERNDYTYAGATAALLESDHGFRQSNGVTLQILSASATDFAMRTCADGGTVPSFEFDSAVGQPIPSKNTC